MVCVKSDWAPVVSGVEQGAVLGPLLFSLHINKITAVIESEIRVFADDCVCYREIKDIVEAFVGGWPKMVLARPLFRPII